MATESDILKALEGLHGPGGAPLAGAVSGVNLSGPKAFVSLVGDPAQKEGWEAARAAAERALKGVPGVEQAIVTLTAER
ncbi:iron-sulfur cluster assembly protein, partial [Methylocystis sp. 9N]